MTASTASPLIVAANATPHGGGGGEPPPKTLSEALGRDDPLQALRAAARASEERASALARDLEEKLSQPVAGTGATTDVAAPTGASFADDNSPGSGWSGSTADSAVSSSIACSESIYHTLTKIASGGSQASQEIRQLESRKRDVDDHAAALSVALALRQHANVASAAVQHRDYVQAAEAVRPWLDFQNDEAAVAADETAKEQSQLTYPSARAYVGESAWAQLEEAHTRLRTDVTALYRKAVQEGDLAALGQLTPVLALIKMEAEAVEWYLQFLRATLSQSLSEAASASAASSQAPPSSKQNPPTSLAVHQKVARVYNLAVRCLRHHLPLVSHCLWQASGDAAVVRLVHSRVQDEALPLLGQHRRERRWKAVTPAASAIASAIADRATGRTEGGGGMSGYYRDVVDETADDCGFSARIGSLADVNLALDEAALLLQHSESYLRFASHCCHEINKARQLRGLPIQENMLLDDAGKVQGGGESGSTLLHQALAELGGEYAAVEHCLLLASMQRSFCIDPEAVDARQYYRPLALSSVTPGGGPSEGGAPAAPTPGSHPSDDAASSALQTAVLEACWYATRKSTQRAFATGHTGTASAVVNFAADALQVLLEVASQRAEDAVSQLESLLLSGSAGSLLAGVMQMHRSHHHPVAGAGVSGAGGTPSRDDLLRTQDEASRGIARACSALNDLEVAASHGRQLEALLRDTAAAGFPQDHATDQLLLCVKSLGTITDGFRAASNAIIESLEGVLKPRIRSILGETAEGSLSSSSSGSTAAAATTFMGSTAMIKGAAGVGVGVGGGERVLARMNYNLNDDKYNLLQLSEGYVSRLTSALDGLLLPLRAALAPRLWDKLLLDVLGTVSKRLEASLRRCEFTALGALALDADLRDLAGYAKDRLHASAEGGASSAAVARACPPLGRLLQISRLLNADDVDDALDLIAAAKRKGQWDLTAEESRAFLAARVEFDADRANELLRLPDDD